MKIKKLILVAPWLDPNRDRTTTFFDFTIDPTVTDRTEVHLLISNDDDEDIKMSVKEITNKLHKAKVHNFQNMGHFTYETMRKHEFPELLEIIIL